MTTIQGYIDYQRREYCRDIKCPIQVLLDQESANTDRYEFIREICNNNCLHTTHEFHAWQTEDVHTHTWIISESEKS